MIDIDGARCDSRDVGFDNAVPLVSVRKARYPRYLWKSDFCVLGLTLFCVFCPNVLCSSHPQAMTATDWLNSVYQRLRQFSAKQPPSPEYLAAIHEISNRGMARIYKRDLLDWYLCWGTHHCLDIKQVWSQGRDLVGYFPHISRDSIADCSTE